jgi:hypothetical protein
VSSRRSSNYDDDHVHDSFSSLTTTPRGTQGNTTTLKVLQEQKTAIVFNEEDDWGDTAPLDTTPTTNGNGILDLDILFGSTTAWGKDKAVSIAVRGALQDAIEDVPLLYMAQRGSPKPFDILPAIFRRHQENHAEMDVLNELRGLASWSEDNGAKRKKNIPIFLMNNLSRKNGNGKYKAYRQYTADMESCADLCPDGLDADLWTGYIQIRLHIT